MVQKLSDMTLEELWRLFPIQLTEHNSSWAAWYEDEKKALISIFGDKIKQIDRIGSTAVKGLLAKPIVDILLQLDDTCDIDFIKQALTQNGWLLMSERGIHSSWNKGYTDEGFADKVFHLHIRELGDWDELYFRDYIATHKVAAVEYEALKRRLLIKHKYNRDAYTEEKGDFIKMCLAKARAEKN